MSQTRFLSICSSVVFLFVLTGLILIKPNQYYFKVKIDSIKSREPLAYTSAQNTVSKEEISESAHNQSGENVQNQIVYNVSDYSQFENNQNLQNIVNDIVKKLDKKTYPIDSLSITLLNVKSGEYGEYQQNISRYPASVVKMFWMVALYGQINTGKWSNSEIFNSDLDKMINQSDNDAASHIIDIITDTQSKVDDNEQNYQKWVYKREWINRYFESNNYKNLNINQKTYPIISENFSSPQGFDLKLRGDPQHPIRNKISTAQTARLMYEIVTQKAITPADSQEMLNWLNRTSILGSGQWKNIDPNQGYFNPIKGFFGEYFAGSPYQVYFASKAGWTSQTRQEVAYINDGQVSYILVVFGEHQRYSKNWQIFPEISELVYQKMKNLPKNRISASN